MVYCPCVSYTHTRLMALFPGLPRWAGTRKVKPIWILLEQETVSGSGISLATCKPAPGSRQITTPAPHHSVFYRPDALPAAQLTASKHWRPNVKNYIHKYTRVMALCLRLPRWACIRKVNTIWILLKQETVSGSGISWAICKSAPRSRQITMPAPHHSVFYRPDALPATQPTSSKHWRQKKWKVAYQKYPCLNLVPLCLKVTCPAVDILEVTHKGQHVVMQPACDRPSLWPLADHFYSFSTVCSQSS